MNYSGVASIVGSALKMRDSLTMKKIREAERLMEMDTKIHPLPFTQKEKTAVEKEMMRRGSKAEYIKNLMEKHKSPQNNGSFDSPPNSSPDMNDIVQRIRLDRNKVLQQGMQPKHLYLGHKQMVALKETKLLDINYVATDRVTYIMYQGFDVFEVDQENHYVMTGE
jgi:hypothetical protein